MLTDSLGAEFGDTLVLVVYHDHGSYMNDEAIERLNFYNTGLEKPYIIFDGTEYVWEQNPANYDSVFNEFFYLARTATALFNLDFDSLYSDSATGSFNLYIMPSDTLPDDVISAFIVVLEDSLPGNYTTHMNVCRDIIQFPVEITYGDTLDTNIVFYHNIPVSNLKVAVFVQDMDTKQLLQARMIKF